MTLYPQFFFLSIFFCISSSLSLFLHLPSSLTIHQKSFQAIFAPGSYNKLYAPEHPQLVPLCSYLNFVLGWTHSQFRWECDVTNLFWIKTLRKLETEFIYEWNLIAYLTVSLNGIPQDPFFLDFQSTRRDFCTHAVGG